MVWTSKNGPKCPVSPSYPVTELLPCPFCGGPAVNIASEFITCGAAWNRECAGHRLKCSEVEWNTRGIAQAAQGQLWSASKHDEIIKRLMADIGHPNSQSIYGAFKQFANELHALSLSSTDHE